MRRVDDAAELTEFFDDDVATHCYSLVDLDEPYWSASRWYRDGDAVAGVVGLADVGIITATAVSTRDPNGSLALLASLAADLPLGLDVTGPVGVAEALAARRQVVDLGLHHKYVAGAGTGPPAPAERDGVTWEALGPADADELAAFYTTDPGAAFFLPAMLGDDTFVGIRDTDGSLIAAGGTHVMSASRRLAAIGSILVRPDRRGRRLGRVVTAAVLDRLAGRADVITLNVADDNRAAIRTYESLGFSRCHTYGEARLA